jgi:hypothetical protein
MSRRGSAQLLLLSFRSHRARARIVGTIAGTVAAVALAGVIGAVMQPAEGGLVQALRQSAWQHALAGLPERTTWPWAEDAPAIASSVPRLGLSASLIKVDAQGGSATIIEPDPAQDPHLPPAKLGDVTIGDHITVTSADGSSRVYRVTGRAVVDPHLNDAASGEQTPQACLSLDSVLELVIQATKVETSSTAQSSPEL